MGLAIIIFFVLGIIGLIITLGGVIPLIIGIVKKVKPLIIAGAIIAAIGFIVTAFSIGLDIYIMTF